MNVHCVYLLESPHRGDSNEYTQYTIFNIKKENHPESFQICSYGIFPRDLKDQFEVAMIKKPSVFKPLTFYCMNRPSAEVCREQCGLATLGMPRSVLSELYYWC